MAENSSGSPAEKKASKPSWKTRMIIFLFLLAVALSFSLWFYIRSTEKQRSEYQRASQEVNLIKEERNRCSALVNQQQGDFGEYEYCRRFLQKFP
jgi:flagellar basal body-associated protein FliL